MSGFTLPWNARTVPGDPTPAIPNPADVPTDFLAANSWSVPFSDFARPDNRFALELRAESIEQIVGGDALRRGENERIEAGGSDGNIDLVAGCDRVQVQGTLDEHTGHGLAMQAAHLDTAVDGSSDTWVGKEDTMLLAGHMRDTWNRGSATVAALCDDLAAGGGVRINALDLWVHGLMGLEERPGTCTADGVLAEACGTLYEREYRTAVHAAGFAVFNGTLYQSVRNSFRPLMRISMGVRNLIAGGGGGAGGEAPPAAPPPAGGGTGAQGGGAARRIGDAYSRRVAGEGLHPRGTDRFNSRLQSFVVSRARDDFAIERTLNAGRLPSDFDARPILEQWDWLISNELIQQQLVAGINPEQSIDTSIAFLNRLNEPEIFTESIDMLDLLKDSIRDALAARYGDAAHPIWLELVDEFLQSRRTDQAAEFTSQSEPRQLGHLFDGLREAAEIHEPLALLYAAEALSGGVDSGPLLRADDAWGRRPPAVRSRMRQEVHFRYVDEFQRYDAEFMHVDFEPVTRIDPTEGWQAVGAPGFGRLSAPSGEFPFSRREQLLSRVMAGEDQRQVFSVTLLGELGRRFDEAFVGGEIDRRAPMTSSMARLLLGLHGLIDIDPSVASVTNLENLDVPTLDALLRLLDSPVRLP